MEELAKTLLHGIITALTWFVIVGALLTFIPPHQRNSLINRFISYFDSFLSPVRRFIPPVGGIDLSPLVVIIVLQVIDSLLRRI